MEQMRRMSWDEEDRRKKEEQQKKKYIRTDQGRRTC